MMPGMQRRADGKGWNLYWDDGAILLEVELMDNGRIGWFWKDRTTGQVEGSAEDDETEFSEQFRRRAKWFEDHDD